MKLVDSHCHLDCLDFTKDDLPASLDEALDSAKAEHIEAFLCVSITLEHFPNVLKIAQSYPNIYASVGVHPTEQEGEEPSAERLLSLADDSNIIAIGETGLDYYWLKDKPEWQRDRFRTHIQVAKTCEKPLIIHTRDAKEDTIRIMKEEGASKGVMHCFTEDYAMAKQAIDLGFYISFSGIVSFKNAKALHEVAQKVPTDRILVETDCPYLAPVPHRGKTNQPAYVKHVAEHIAMLRNESVEQVAEYTTQNFNTLFGTSV